MYKPNYKCPYAAVVGAVNIDIGGRSYKPLIPRDSNPGTVSISPGGVGRNIAHNIRLLGADVKFITAMGDDLYAKQIAEHCGQIGIDLSCSVNIKGVSTSTYLFIAGPDGDMSLAISDTDIAGYITPDFIKDRLDVLNNAAAVVFDTNLTEETIKFIAENCAAPLFTDPVSVSKAYKLKPALKYLHTIKPNVIEAELLSGIKITDGRSLEKAARYIVDKGVKNVFITLGDKGVFFKSADEEAFIPASPAEVINTTGAGDAFCATLVWSFINGIKPADAALYGSAASAMTIETRETINERLNLNEIKARLGQ